MNRFSRVPRSIWIALGVLAIFVMAIPVAYLLIANAGTASANSPELVAESHSFFSDHKVDLKKNLRPSQLDTLSSGSGCICEVLDNIRNSDRAYSDECKSDARRLYRQLCAEKQNQCDGGEKVVRNDDHDDHKVSFGHNKPKRHAEATPAPTSEPEHKGDKPKKRRHGPKDATATDEWPTPWAPSATPEMTMTAVNDPCEAFPGLCTEEPQPTYTRRPTRTPYPTDTDEPAPTRRATRTPYPTDTDEPEPTNTRRPTATDDDPDPTNTVRPTRTPYPTDTEEPEPTNTRRPTRTPYPTDTDEPEPTARPSRTPEPTATDEDDAPRSCHAVKHDYPGPERQCRRIRLTNPLIIDIENHGLPLPGSRPPYDENSIIAMDGYDGYMNGEGAVWEYVGDDCDYEYVKGRQDLHIETRNKDRDFIPKKIGATSLSRAERLEILTEECPRYDPEPTNTVRPTRTPLPTDTDEPEPTARPSRTPRPTATEDGGGYPPPPTSCESISPLGGEIITDADGLDIPATQWVQAEFWFIPGDGTEWTRLEAGPLDTGALDSKGRIKIWRYLKSDCTRYQIEEEHIKPHFELRRDAGKNPVWADDHTWRRLLRQ